MHIASIFFDELHIERPLYGGSYVFPPVPKDETFLLHITDKIQMEPIPQIMGGGNVPRNIPAAQIARDIVEQLTTKSFGMSPSSHPGVWIVRETLPHFDDEGMPVMETVLDDKGKPVERQSMRPATAEEKQQMYAEDLEENRQAQYNYAEYEVNRGDHFNEEPAQRVLITNRMKKAALYLGREVEWLKRLKDLNHGDTRACPFCTKTVRAKAVKCPHCQEVIDYDQYAAMEADRKEKIAEAKRNRAA